MNGPSDELLAGARLSGDEDRGVGRRRTTDGLSHLLGRRTGTHHLVAAFEAKPQTTDFLLQLLPLQGIANREQNPFRLERFLDEIESTQLRRLHRRLNVSVSADDDDLRRRRELLEPTKHLESIHPRHLDVQKGEIGRVVLHDFERLGARSGLGDLEALVLECHTHGLANGLLVVHYQNSGFHRFHSGDYEIGV